MKIFFLFHPSAFIPHPFRDPFADERGLAKAGGGRDKGQPAVRREALVQPLDQAGAEDDLRPEWWDVQFSS
jgi:hypothetical protein